MFQRIMLTALFAGLIAGVFAWGAHMAKTTPLIVAAEVYETAAPAAVTEPVEWAPADGLERNLMTLVADVVTAIGFAFMLTGAFALSGRPVDARAGMAWGMAGFAVFFAAPALGLAPELPGMQAADLGARQAWWLFTAAATAAGIAMIAFAPRPSVKALGVVVLALPHVVGAPHPEIAPGIALGAVPAELAAQFAAATLVITGLTWLLLGGLAGYFYRRFERP